MTQGELKGKIGDRFKAVRFRTYVLTAIIVTVLVFYYMVNVATRASIAWIDFILICIVQILAHFIYYPDGKIYGQKDEVFVANRTAYNTKAKQVNTEDKHESLREFCEWEYNERKRQYVLTQCGYIGISERELEALKKKDKQELKHIEEFKWTEKVGDQEIEKVVKFSRSKRKLLYDLIYKPIPVEKNNDSTIMTAVENNKSRKITDESKPYDRNQHIKRLLWTGLISAVMAYVIYTVRDNFGIAEFVQILLCVFSLVATAVTSYTSGEQSTRVYKSTFYLELANFLEEFLEWEKKHRASTTPIVEIKAQDQYGARLANALTQTNELKE